LAFAGVRARFVSLDELLDGFSKVFALHAGHGRQITFHRFSQRASAQLARRLDKL
jgi:hypothetical protein